ncbi:MAG: 6-carboxytetrahydropterin synthase QueD [Candidatus Omnitrophica bacterium]|nr:6-carboxytetrahydropterin synthase QueD [Candidatus Omnitrophota bacterium]
MFTIKIRNEFSSAHNLRGYKGKCENLHGHNWKVEAEISKENLDKCGMVRDFRDIKKYLSEILERLDHKHINNLAYFKKHNPTSENIAKYIYDSLKKHFEGLVQVTVWESDNSSASYRET